jgi:hypothetical protein
LLGFARELCNLAASAADNVLPKLTATALLLLLLGPAAAGVLVNHLARILPGLDAAAALLPPTVLLLGVGAAANAAAIAITACSRSLCRPECIAAAFAVLLKLNRFCNANTTTKSSGLPTAGAAATAAATGAAVGALSLPAALSGPDTAGSTGLKMQDGR